MYENEIMSVPAQSVSAPLAMQGGNVPMLATQSAMPTAVRDAETARMMVIARFQMAKACPRDEESARLKIIKTCKRPAFAEVAEYAKPVGKDYRTGGQTFAYGPSVRFAEMCMRVWGNIECKDTVVYEDDEVRRVRLTVTDLESNASFEKEISISKLVERKSDKGREVIRERVNTYGDKIYVVRATDDELQMKTDALLSKARRNEGLRLIPQDIKDEAMEVCRSVMRNQDAVDPEMAKRKLIDAFYSYGVTPQNLSEFLGHDLQVIAPAEFEQLRAVYLAIRQGEAHWADFMAKPETEEGEPDENVQKAKKKLDELKTKKKAEKKQREQPAEIPAEPVVENGETASLNL